MDLNASGDCSISCVIQPRPLFVYRSLCTTCNPFASVDIYFLGKIDKTIFVLDTHTQISLFYRNRICHSPHAMFGGTTTTSTILHGVYWTLFFLPTYLFIELTPKRPQFNVQASWNLSHTCVPYSSSLLYSIATKPMDRNRGMRQKISFMWWTLGPKPTKRIEREKSIERESHNA
jgi:hypothetical protein